MFSTYVTQHEKFYATQDEYHWRKSIFASTLQKIEAHNNADHSFKLGITKFADWTKDEYKSLSNYKPSLESSTC